MNFRLVPKSMTLNGVMALFCIISANSGSFRAHCVKIHVHYLIWWVLVTKIFGSLKFLSKTCFALDTEHYGPIPELTRQIMDGWYAYIDKWRWWMWMVAAIYRRTHSPSQLAWSVGWRLSLHSSNEPGELSQWPWSRWQHHKHCRWLLLLLLLWYWKLVKLMNICMKLCRDVHSFL